VAIKRVIGRQLDSAAQADAQEGILQGLEDERAGRLRPVREFSAQFEAATPNSVSERPTAATSRRIAAGLAAVAAPEFMSRNFYILAATLAFFALISAGMSLAPSSFQPGLPANASLWRTVALFLLLASLASALAAVMSHLFEQVDRRSEETRLAARRKRRGEKH